MNATGKEIPRTCDVCEILGRSSEASVYSHCPRSKEKELWALLCDKHFAEFGSSLKFLPIRRLAVVNHELAEVKQHSSPEQRRAIFVREKNIWAKGVLFPEDHEYVRESYYSGRSVVPRRWQEMELCRTVK